MTSTQPYDGRTRKLILAFDVGTTYSGVGYAILDPGEVPKIQCVTRFPGQENGDFKIPSILWYTQAGTVRAAGAEARDLGIEMTAEEENLIFVEWFKLHLRPQSLADTHKDFELQPLPPGKSVVDVFADFLAYLLLCAKTYIIDSHPSGQSLWDSVESDFDVVLSHPNGWAGMQQEKMRQAAVKAKLVEDSAVGRRRVSFVTEGEASVQYCVGLGMAVGSIKAGSTIMLVDAGGGTVDLSSYCFTSTSPIMLDEIAPVGCILQGSTQVNVRAERFLRTKLAGSKYGYYDEIKNMLASFETYTKPTFKSSADKAIIKFGSMRDQDPNYGIRNGQLVLEGADVATLFDPATKGIMEAIHEQQDNASKPISELFLVGGFSASPWLYQQLKTALQAEGMKISRPDNHMNKAVAEGAVSFALEHFVGSRVAPMTYGVCIDEVYVPDKIEHLARQSHTYIDVTGKKMVKNRFLVLVSRGTQFKETAEVKYALYHYRKTPQELQSVWVNFMVYRGSKPVPLWTDSKNGQFTTLCKVTANTSEVTKSPTAGPNGTYYVQRFQIVLSVGRTEMQAQLAWDEKGVERRGPGQIIYYE